MVVPLEEVQEASSVVYVENFHATLVFILCNIVWPSWRLPINLELIAFVFQPNHERNIISHTSLSAETIH